MPPAGLSFHLQDMMRQQGWKVERVTKENRALELQNVELRKQAADVRAENLEVRRACACMHACMHACVCFLVCACMCV